MHDHDAPVDSPVAAQNPGSTFFDGDFLAATWSGRSPAGSYPQRPDAALRVSAALLLFGIVLLVLFPLGGALLLITGALGLAFWWETSMGELTPARSPVTSNTSTADPRPTPPSAGD